MRILAMDLTQHFCPKNPHLIKADFRLPQGTINTYAGLYELPFLTLSLSLATQGPPVTAEANFHRATKFLKGPLNSLYLAADPASLKYVARVEQQFYQVLPQFLNSPLWNLTICLSSLVTLYTAPRPLPPLRPGSPPYGQPVLLSSLSPRTNLSPTQRIRHAKACLDRYLTRDLAHALLRHPHPEVRLACITSLRALNQTHPNNSL